MRRIVPAVLAVTAALGLAAPASAAEGAKTERPIELSCQEVTTDGSRPTVHCQWNAFEGAESYRVVGVVRRHHSRVVVHAPKTTETSFTRKARPGHYVFVVRALGEDGKAVARSNAQRVVLHRQG